MKHFGFLNVACCILFGLFFVVVVFVWLLASGGLWWDSLHFLFLIIPKRHPFLSSLPSIHSPHQLRWRVIKSWQHKRAFTQVRSWETGASSGDAKAEPRGFHSIISNQETPTLHEVSEQLIAAHIFSLISHVPFFSPKRWNGHFRVIETVYTKRNILWPHMQRDDWEREKVKKKGCPELQQQHHWAKLMKIQSKRGSSSPSWCCYNSPPFLIPMWHFLREEKKKG